MNDRERRRKKREAQRLKILETLFIGCFLIICFFMAVSMYFTTKKGHTPPADSQEVKTTKIPPSPDTETEENQDMDIESVPVMKEENEYARILSLSPGECAVYGFLGEDMAGRLFYESDITKELPRIQGISYQENPNVALTDLAYLRMLYWGIDGNTYVGEMIVNQKIKEDVLNIFRTLYENRYPIERMVLVDEYAGEDEASMEANNTSAFNYRTISGSDKLSNHSYGMAVDLNPKYNPYVKRKGDGSVICQPESGRAYADRTKEFDYKIDENDLAYQLFTQAGFTWGGDWNSVKDYQHFEKE